MAVASEPDDAGGEVVSDLSAHFRLDRALDFLGIGNPELLGRDFQLCEIIPVIAEDFVETIPAARHVIPAHIRRTAQRRGEWEIGGAPDFPLTIMGGDRDEGEGDIALLAEADRSDRAFLGMPEQPEILFHAIPLPAAIRDMLEAGLFHRHGGFARVREKRRIRDWPLTEAVFDGQSHSANAGQQLDPWQEQPNHRAAPTGGEAAGQEIQHAKTGGEKCQRAELAQARRASRAQGDSEHE